MNEAPERIIGYWSPSERCLFVDRAPIDPNNLIEVAYIRADVAASEMEAGL